MSKTWKELDFDRKLELMIACIAGSAAVVYTVVASLQNFVETERRWSMRHACCHDTRF